MVTRPVGTSDNIPFNLRESDVLMLKMLQLQQRGRYPSCGNIGPSYFFATLRRLLMSLGAVQQGNKLLLDLLGFGTRGKALNRNAVLVHKERREVPLDRRSSENPRNCGLEVLVQRRGLVAVHVDLGHDRELGRELLARELLDLLLSSGLLPSKLVAREGEHSEPELLVLAVQRLCGLVALIGVAALRGDVVDEERLALVLLEVVRLLVGSEDFEVVDRRHVGISRPNSLYLRGAAAGHDLNSFARVYYATKAHTEKKAGEKNVVRKRHTLTPR
jgi:hypothetical protein